MRIIKAKQGQDLYAIALQELNNVLAVFDIAMANEYSITSTLDPGQLINIPAPGTYENRVTEFMEPPIETPVENFLKSIVSRNGQSLYDIALQELGSVEGVIELSLQNNLMPTTDLLPSQLIKSPIFTIDKNVVNEMKSKKIHPATAQLIYRQYLFTQGLFEYGFFE